MHTVVDANSLIIFDFFIIKCLDRIYIDFFLTPIKRFFSGTHL